ncbi:MAG: multiheme c-type cytochrome [Candidatus Limnocylindrales bacterium]
MSRRDAMSSRLAPVTRRLGSVARHLASIAHRLGRLVGRTIVTLRSIRPPRIGWRRIIRQTLKVGVVIVVVSVALGVGAFAAVTLAAQYGASRDVPDSHTWAALTPRFAGQASCTVCHATEANAKNASIHVYVTCEVCHGPAAAHVADPTTAKNSLPEPTSDICATCHVAVPGRPADFPQIERASHYSGGQCLRCHDPHSIVAIRPPTVTHPLADLPACTTCHAPNGLKPIPSGHEPVADAVCLSCHGPQAGGGR